MLETYDLKQAAKILKLNPQTIKRKAREGKISFSKPGRAYLFTSNQITEYLKMTETKNKVEK